MSKTIYKPSKFFCRRLLIEKKDKLKKGDYYLHEVINEKNFEKNGFITMEEIWKAYGKSENETAKIHAAYNLNGDYIGEVKTAALLNKKYGINHFEKTSPESNICTIGYSPKTKKWYGWSHRAICGFSKGSKTTMKSASFIPSNPEEFLKSLNKKKKELDFKTEYILQNNGIVHKGTHIESGRVTEYFYPFPKVWGRGEYVAKNLNDAKQMAIDFAKSVS